MIRTIYILLLVLGSINLYSQNQDSIPTVALKNTFEVLNDANTSPTPFLTNEIGVQLESLRQEHVDTTVVINNFTILVYSADRVKRVFLEKNVK